MKLIIAFSLLMLCACARPQKAMFQVDKYETVSKLCASPDIIVAGVTARKPYDPKIGLEREPIAEFILLSKGSLISRLPAGRGAIRSLIEYGDGFMGAVAVSNESGGETAEIYSITAQGGLTKLPPLSLALAGLVADADGRLTAYGYGGEAWQLDPAKSAQSWHRLSLDAGVIRNPLRAIVRQKDGRYAVITDKEVIGVPSLTDAPAWAVPYSGSFISAIQADRLWILTHEPGGAAISYLNTSNQSLVKMAGMPDFLAQRLLPLPDDELLLFASGRGGRQAKRSYFRIDTKADRVIGPKELPDYVTTVCTIGNLLIFATNSGEIYEYDIEHESK